MVETAAAAGSSLGVHALIAAAAEKRLDAREAKLLEQAYFPWIGGLHSLLDNLIDKHEDEAAGHRSLVEYYGPQRAAERMRWMAEQAVRLAAALPHSRRHTVVLAGMIGNYLSTPEAHSPELAPGQRGGARHDRRTGPADDAGVRAASPAQPFAQRCRLS